MTRNKLYEIVLKKKIKSADNRPIYVSILRHKKKLNVEITVGYPDSQHSISIRLHEEEFLEIFDNDIGFDPGNNIDQRAFWNLNYGRSRTLRFRFDGESMAFEIFYNGYLARSLWSSSEVLESLWKLVHSDILDEFKQLASKISINQ
jgi:hypothetical protein